jgi:cytochrome c553
MTLRTRCVLLAVLATLLPARPAPAEAKRSPLPPPYVTECGSCHVAFPARMLDAASWNAVLDGLERHFGVDASLDAATLGEIRAYLEGSARSRPTTADGKPLLRITETRWFRHEHDEVPTRLWQEPGAIRPADCAACHTQAATGSYAERELRLPKKGEAR